jgi:hypothetical protein
MIQSDPVEPGQQRADLLAAQHHRQALRPLCPRDALEPTRIATEDLLVQEEHRSQRLILRRCGYFTLDGGGTAPSAHAAPLPPDAETTARKHAENEHEMQLSRLMTELPSPPRAKSLWCEHIRFIDCRSHRVAVATLFPTTDDPHSAAPVLRRHPHAKSTRKSAHRQFPPYPPIAASTAA